MTEIKWEEPRDNRLGAGFDEIAAALRTRPGHWAQVMTGLTKSRTQASSLALGIRRGKYKDFQPHGEFQSRSSGGTVWARWIGENGEYANVGGESEEASKVGA